MHGDNRRSSKVKVRFWIDTLILGSWMFLGLKGFDVTAYTVEPV